MKTDEPKTIRLEAYEKPAFEVENLHLDVELDPGRTLVKSRLKMRRAPQTDPSRPLRLEGEKLDLVSLTLNGEKVSANGYAQDEEGLSIFNAPDKLELEVTTAIAPEKNTELEGLYLSNNMFCTQCEAEGFRKITFFPDRPDVMCVYTTRITADKKRNPVLLSNGNKIASGDLDEGRHWAEWHDPFPKPSYLFALVAGDLACVEDHFRTCSGRDVTLQIFVEKGDEDRCAYAMDALKRSMKWDEEVFGREYDLDIFMIVAVSHFNMGAMENKGLNIFNSQYILANPDTATDTDYELIEGIIAHEYFHNWTGNRITCRDWFQLCLKEGLTVFRDQQFSADMRSPAVQRIKDVRALRSRQFKEDAGPLAHPVRPASYMEINNFYTATVYEKGAELVRMMHTLAGEQGFRRGMDLYFERHDGEAATVEDFVTAMEDGAKIDLTQFRLWYSQAGTPTLHVKEAYDESAQTYRVTLSQETRPTKECAEKKPFDIPVLVSLFDKKGACLTSKPSGVISTAQGTLLRLTKEKETFEFTGVDEKPTLSLLRNFSAPVTVHHEISNHERAFLMAHDTDLFNRWEAGQAFAQDFILKNVAALQKGKATQTPDLYIEALKRTLLEQSLEPYFRAEALALPGENQLAQAMEVIDPDAIHEAREAALSDLAEHLEDELLDCYERYRIDKAYRPDGEQAGKRALRNRVLSILAHGDKEKAESRAFAQFENATNMTDCMAALSVLANLDCPQRQKALDGFYEKWKDNTLVVNKWLSVQATSTAPGTLEHLKTLYTHESFSLSNPNKVRALVGAFAMNNPVRFHDASGAGYAFWADTIRTLDPQNPQLAARLLGAAESWRAYDSARQEAIGKELQAILDVPNISKNVFEIASKLLT